MSQAAFPAASPDLEFDPERLHEHLRHALPGIAFAERRAYYFAMA
ncbi:hypothetical protein AB4Z46_07715 [Variovorax sp. M-6]